MRRLGAWLWSWTPGELGRSLPIAPGFRRAAAAAALVAVAGLAVLAWTLLSLDAPEVAPLPAAEVRRVAADKLARAELPAWDPGAPLESAELAAALVPSPPPPWQGRVPGDPAVADTLAAEARRELREGDAVHAATLYGRAVAARPGSWELRYGEGVSLARAGFHAEAAASLGRALELLTARAARHGDDPTYLAALVHTRYALAHAHRPDDCIESIRHLKLAMQSLQRLAASEAVPVFHRRLPFRLEPGSLSSLDVWTALAGSYLGCERYPAGYFARYPQGKRFREAEYDDPELAEVREGPFPRELAGCIGSGGETSRCWALANLNKLHAAVRGLYPEPGKAPTAAWKEFRRDLARLAYAVARLAAEGEDREGASLYLRQAAALQRAAPAEVGLEAEIESLGRYLAAELRDYSLLAEPYRGRPIDALPLADDTPPEALKGMAWALTERWQALLAAGRPEDMTAEIDAARRRVPGVYLASFDAWRAEARSELERALAEAMVLERRRGNLSTAVGLRRFRPDYLGPGWPARARAAWWTPALTAKASALVGLYLLLVAGLALALRYVVYPYLLYTSEYYRSEFTRRHEERRQANRPLTGREIGDWMRRRAGG